MCWNSYSEGSGQSLRYPTCPVPWALWGYFCLPPSPLCCSALAPGRTSLFLLLRNTGDGLTSTLLAAGCLRQGTPLSEILCLELNLQAVFFGVAEAGEKHGMYLWSAPGAAHEQGPTFLLSFHASAPGLVPDLLTHAD